MSVDSTLTFHVSSSVRSWFYTAKIPLVFSESSQKRHELEKLVFRCLCIACCGAQSERPRLPRFSYVFTAAATRFFTTVWVSSYPLRIQRKRSACCCAKPSHQLGVSRMPVSAILRKRYATEEITCSRQRQRHQLCGRYGPKLPAPRSPSACCARLLQTTAHLTWLASWLSCANVAHRILSQCNKHGATVWHANDDRGLTLEPYKEK